MRRLRVWGVILLLAPILLAAHVAQVAGHIGGCSVHATETRPPREIRVRLSPLGQPARIVRVPFALYVARVVSSEWNTVPDATQRAGALAVKQYAWWKALHPRLSAQGCFDVHSDTRDQIYRVKPNPPSERIWGAVRAIWGWRVVYDGRLIQTGYRTGGKWGCAQDADRFHLYARSSTQCALLGWGPRRILEAYYRGAVRT